MRARDVIVEPRQGCVEALRLEQPVESCLSVLRAAKQFSILLQDRCIIRLRLRALSDGSQRQVVLSIQVIGLGEVILRVSVAGKNLYAVLQHLESFFLLARS